MNFSRDPGRTVTVAVVQAGTDHSRDGKPGPEANFGLLAGLAREAAQASPDLIVFPEYAISGWPYPPEATINGLAEVLPGEGPWARRYVALAREVKTPILGWLVEARAGRLYNAALMRIGQCPHNGQEQPHCPFRLENLTTDLLQCSPLHIAHNDVCDLNLLTIAMNRHDIGMVEFGNRLGFPAEPLHEFGILGKEFTQDFDSHITIQSWFVGLIYSGHAALTQPLHQLICSQSVPDQSVLDS